jgi:PhnB protein
LKEEIMANIVPHLTLDRGVEAIDFYKRAFGFEEAHRMPGPGGKIMHCELRLGESVIFLADEFPEMGGSCRSPKTLGGSTVTIHVESPDVDAAFARATQAGATAIMPPMDMFWGDRYCKLADPFGHHWSLSTHKEDLTHEEMKKRGEAFFKNMKPK